MTLFRRLTAVLHREDTITFCDRCGQACNSACRRTAALDRAHSRDWTLPRP